MDHFVKFKVQIYVSLFYPCIVDEYVRNAIRQLKSTLCVPYQARQAKNIFVFVVVVPASSTHNIIFTLDMKPQKHNDDIIDTVGVVAMLNNVVSETFMRSMKMT